MRKYLLTLQKSGLEWLHAIIWCITPEDRVRLSLSSILTRLPLSFLDSPVLPLEAAVPAGAGCHDQAVGGEVHLHLGERHHPGQGGQGGHQAELSGAGETLHHIL